MGKRTMNNDPEWLLGSAFFNIKVTKSIKGIDSGAYIRIYVRDDTFAAIGCETTPLFSADLMKNRLFAAALPSMHLKNKGYKLSDIMWSFEQIGNKTNIEGEFETCVSLDPIGKLSDWPKIPKKIKQFSRCVVG